MIPQEYDPAQYGEETYTYEDLPAAAGPEYPEAQMQPEAAAAPQPDYYAVQEEPAAAVPGARTGKLRKSGSGSQQLSFPGI